MIDEAWAVAGSFDAQDDCKFCADGKPVDRSKAWVDRWLVLRCSQMQVFMSEHNGE